MAKWGEGDPRWIVEQRADATNVNNWHWTERDVSSWSSERLRQLLLEVRVEGSEGVCQLTDVSKLEGEASINNRKGKLFFFYEWQLRAGWLGTSSRGVKFRGNIDVSNLSDENDLEDLDISASLCKDQPDTPLLELMRRRGVEEVRRVLGDYVTQLKSEFSQGMVLPTSTGPAPAPAPAPAPNQIKTSKTQIGSPRFSSGPAGAQIPTVSFTLRETFQTSADELYSTFINQELVQVFTRSAAAVDGRVGGKFRLLDGSVSGEFTQLVSQSVEMRRCHGNQVVSVEMRRCHGNQVVSVEMRRCHGNQVVSVEMRRCHGNQDPTPTGRLGFWFPVDHVALVRLQLEEQGDQTELTMDCGGVPSAEEDSTREGWTRFYFQAIRQTFGY
ncbi:activator of 90 kDa heat shock protein ATPase homolog 1-like [Scomber japonicus]|uniref:activator of 90 kDa heat shock protein ATPase homolog 1-like n=1 Tax=Scomber japonicus TaxID=13676 RepID=UPI002304E77E|nr:activator of 90 kDa heat shock protein ATPase homolog 1-like [Scomber japonicus]